MRKIEQEELHSQPNIERLIWLEAQGLIHPKIRKRIRLIILAVFLVILILISCIAVVLGSL